MVTLNPISLTQAEFKTAPEAERLFYLKLGLITNEVSSLNKLTLFSLHQLEDIEVLNRAGSTLGLLQLRLLAGRLYEAHSIITAGFKPLMLAYRSKKNANLRNIYRQINAYFGDPSNLVKAVRHKLAFHSDDAVFRAGVALMSEEDDLTDYMCEQRGDSLFWSAEVAMVAALQHVTGAKNSAAAYGKLMDDLHRVAMLVNDFTFAFAVAFFDRHFPEKRKSVRAIQIEITSAPKLTEMSLPFFYETPIKA